MNTLILEAVEKAPHFKPDQTTKKSRNDLSSPTEVSLPAVTARELFQQIFKPLIWVVENILPEGLTILAGAPKLGKSWMALDIAISVSTGKNTLGTYATTQGAVLYLALEDSHRRLQQRLRIIAEESQISDNLSLCTQIPHMDDGGIKAIENWIDKHPTCRLIIIDTLARFTPRSDGNVNIYEREYRVLARLQQFAMSKGIALIVVTHLRKQKAEDALEEVTGSTAITGAADTVWLLKRERGQKNGVLTVTGRDIEEQQLSAEFNKVTCQWSVLEDTRQDSQRNELSILKAKYDSKPFTYTMTEDALKVSNTQAKRVVSRLLAGGYVIKLKDKTGKAYQFKITDIQENNRPTSHNSPTVAGLLNEITGNDSGLSVQPSKEIDCLYGEFQT